jgi:hypothetical protein
MQVRKNNQQGIAIHYRSRLLPIIRDFYDNIIQFDVSQTDYPADAYARNEFYKKKEEQGERVA